jgi:hypothetical protein
MTSSERTTGNDPVEGVDPGGTHSTKPGNPDKSGPAKPGQVSQDVVSGDNNAGRPASLQREPKDTSRNDQAG